MSENLSPTQATTGKPGEITLGTTIETTIDATLSHFGLNPAPIALENPAVHPYKLMSCLGTGGMGSVYEAVNAEGNQKVALKTMHALDDDVLERLKSEFRAVVHINHPNLVRVFELKNNDATVFFTMELVRGEALYPWAKQWDVSADTPPSPAYLQRVERWLLQLCRGIEALHGQGVLHLDLKPSNVLVEGSDAGDDGRIVLLDFGLARSIASPQDGAGQGVYGTPAYMAPEQARAEEPTEASDCYAVGVMLYQLLSHRLPFEGPALGVITQKIENDVPDIRKMRPGIPERLAQLCMGLLTKDAQNRLGLADVFAVIGAAPQRAERAPQGFFGREGELSTLAELVNPACDGPKVVLVTGPGGVGKSAFCRHFFQADGADLLRFEGRCYEWETVPFKGVDQIVAGLCQAVLEQDQAQQSAFLTRELVSTAQIFPCLKRIAGFEAFRKTVPEIADRGELRLRAFDGLTALIARLADGAPVVFFVDDLHWADSDSALLISALFNNPAVPNLIVVGSCRVEGLEERPFFQALTRNRFMDMIPYPVERLEIPPLEATASQALARTVLGAEAADALVQHIAEESGGSPFFIEQLAQFSRDEPKEAAPVAVGTVIGHQLDRLSADVRRILEVVAVAGRPTSQGVILRAAGGEGQFHDQLAQLRQWSMVRTHGPRTEHLVEPYHDRIREGVVGLLSDEKRCEIHGDLVDTLEQQATLEHDLLAFHAHGAGRLDQASKYAERAASKAEEGLAFVRAASFYQDALNWGEMGKDRRRRLLFRRGRALSHGGRDTDAAPLFAQAAEGQSDDRRRQLLRMASECYLTSGHIDEGLNLLRPLLKELGMPLSNSSIGSLLSLLWQVFKLWRRGTDFELNTQVAHSAEAFLQVDIAWTLGKGLSNVLPIEGADYMIRSLLGALKLGDPERIGRGLSFLSIGLASVNRKAKVYGENYLRRAEECAEITRSPHLRGFNFISQGAGHLMEGNWREALEHADQGLLILKEQCTGVSWECTIGEGLAIKVLEITGRMNEAFLRARLWRREASGRGDAYAVEICDYFIGLSQLAAGDVAQCRELNDPALKDWSEKYTVQHFYWMRLIAWCDLYEGRAKEAQDRLASDEKNIKTANLRQVPLSRIEVNLLEATILLALAERKGLKRCAELSKAFKKETRADCQVHGRMIDAGLLWHAGKKRQASDLWQACSAEFLEMEMPLPAALAGLFYAEAVDDGVRKAGEVSALKALGVADPFGWAQTYLCVFPHWVGQDAA